MGRLLGCSYTVLVIGDGGAEPGLVTVAVYPEKAGSPGR
jgi:hypothetical protein